MAESDVDLSVVFVTRNEEEHIEDCIRTTMLAVDAAIRERVIRRAEYILVDSASTDRTVEVASRFPILIAHLEPTWPLSCGAGCHVGLQRARGTYTAIINGDMTIDPLNFVGSLRHFAPDVGAVCGVAKEELGRSTVVERALIRHSSVQLDVGKLPPELTWHPGGFSAGTFIVRTEAARAVGSYNPFFRAAEDTDLRHRLLRAGWRVLNLPVVQGVHFWSTQDEPLELLPYFRTILRNSIGLGQMARFHVRRDRVLARKAAGPCLNARTLIQMLHGLGLAALAATHALILVTLHPIAIGAAIGADVAFVAYLILRRRLVGIPANDVAFLATMYPPTFGLVRLAGFVTGFLPRPHGPEEYPKNVRVTGA